MVGRTKDEEVLRQLERLLDHEVRTIEEIDDKLELLLGFHLAVIGGGIALARNLAAAPTNSLGASPPPVVLALLAGGTLVLGVSFLLLLRGYLGWSPGTGPDTVSGPSPAALVAARRDSRVTFADLLEGLIYGYQAYIDELEDTFRTSVAYRRMGLAASFTGLGLYTAATFITVAGGM